MNEHRENIISIYIYREREIMDISLPKDGLLSDLYIIIFTYYKYLCEIPVWNEKEINITEYFLYDLINNENTFYYKKYSCMNDKYKKNYLKAYKELIENSIIYYNKIKETDMEISINFITKHLLI